MTRSCANATIILLYCIYLRVEHRCIERNGRKSSSAQEICLFEFRLLEQCWLCGRLFGTQVSSFILQPHAVFSLCLFTARVHMLVYIKTCNLQHESIPFSAKNAIAFEPFGFFILTFVKRKHFTFQSRGQFAMCSNHLSH